MTQTLREKVARAIGSPYDTGDDDARAFHWSKTSPEYQRLYLAQADAAILVCREHFAAIADRLEFCDTPDGAATAAAIMRAIEAEHPT